MNKQIRIKKPSSVPSINSSSASEEFSSELINENAFSTALHDFNRIQIHAPTTETVQTKLAVNQPGDAYEQEADRVAEQVIQMEAPELSESPPESQGAKLGTNDFLTRNVTSDKSEM